MKRLILIVGGNTIKEIQEGLQEIVNDSFLLTHNNCIGGLSNGNQFDFTIDTTEKSISIANFLDSGFDI